MSNDDFPMPARARRGRGPRTKRAQRALTERREREAAHVEVVGFAEPDPELVALLRARRKAA